MDEAIVRAPPGTVKQGQAGWPEDAKPKEIWAIRDKAKAIFQLGFLGRMIFSCLVDAD